MAEMDFLPSLPTIAAPMRVAASIYDENFRMAIKEYIVIHFQAEPCDFDNGLDELKNLKLVANDPPISVESALLLKRYFGQLNMMEKRFPMGPGQPLETPFSWYDSLSENSVTVCDIAFEQASVMYNIGALHGKLAQGADRETEDGLKTAFMHFQSAAYPFEYLSKMKYDDQFYPSTDFDPEMMELFHRLMLAQAQECLTQKSVMDKKSPTLIASLAKHLQLEYDRLFNLCETISQNSTTAERLMKVGLFGESQSLPADRFKFYKKLLGVKRDLYAAVCYYQLGVQAETEEKMGHRYGYFKIAENHMVEKVGALMAKGDIIPGLEDGTSAVLALVVDKYNKAKKENDFIYHARVPTDEELNEPVKDGGVNKAKALEFSWQDASVVGYDLFGSLLPPTVLQSVSVYETQKTNLKRQIGDELMLAENELDQFLVKADVPTLRHMLQNGRSIDKMYSLPDILLERNAALTAQPDAIPTLLDRLRESAETAKVAEARLNTLIGKLKAIDLPQLTSDEGYVAILKELERLHEHDAQARENNASLQKALAAHSSSLNLLSLPVHELRRNIIPKAEDAANAAATSAEEELLKKLITKIDEMRVQRSKLFDRLQQELNQDDITTALLAEKEFDHEEVFKKALKKHDETLSIIRLNIAAQSNILTAFTEANADYADEKMKLERYMDEFKEKVMVLVTAYDIYTDVCKKVAEGETFYQQLNSRCDKLQGAVHAIDSAFQAEQEKRANERRAMEERLEAARRQRQAREALNDFAGPAGPPHHSQLPPVGPPQPPFTAPTGPPKLRDFMDEYRNRKAGIPPTTQNMSVDPRTQYQPNFSHHESAPSPAPSSVVDFQMSPRPNQPQSYTPSSGIETPILSTPANSFTPIQQHQPLVAPQNMPPLQHPAVVHQHHGLDASPYQNTQEQQKPEGQWERNNVQQQPHLQGGHPDYSLQQPQLHSQTYQNQQQPHVQGGQFQQPYGVTHYTNQPLEPTQQSVHQLPQVQGGQNFPPSQPQQFGGLQQPQLQGGNPPQARNFGGLQQPHVQGGHNFQQPQSKNFGGFQQTHVQETHPSNSQNFGGLQQPQVHGGQVPHSNSFAGSQQPQGQVAQQYQPQSFAGLQQPQLHGGQMSQNYGQPKFQGGQSPQPQVIGSLQQPQFQGGQMSQNFGGLPQPQVQGGQSPLPQGVHSRQQPQTQGQQISQNFGGLQQPQLQGGQSFQSQNFAPPQAQGVQITHSQSFSGLQQPHVQGGQSPQPQAFDGRQQYQLQGNQMSQNFGGLPQSQGQGNQSSQNFGGNQQPQAQGTQVYGVQQQPGVKQGSFGQQSINSWNPSPVQDITRSSPWHSTPTIGGQSSPWLAGVQQPYGAVQPPPQMAPVQQQQPVYNVHQQPQQQGVNQAQPQGPCQGSGTNVDLLSSLLGDLNLPQALQPVAPTLASSQNLQNAPPPSQDQFFRIAEGQERTISSSTPVKPPSLQPPHHVSTVSTSSTQSLSQTPVAAVIPIQQAVNVQDVAAEPHPLSINQVTSVSSFAAAQQTSMNLTDLIDPAKFQLGIGDKQKLEKRMLHASIRSGTIPAPPLDPSDPLNQINAFSMVKK